MKKTLDELSDRAGHATEKHARANREAEINARILKPKQVREMRLAMNLSQRGLADAIGLGKDGSRRVEGWETGEQIIGQMASLSMRYLFALTGIRSNECAAQRIATDALPSFMQ